METLDLESPEQPLVVTCPDELAGLVQANAQSCLPLIDYGLAHAGLGHPPPQPHLQVRQHSEYIEHYREDFVVRAAAGVTLAHLQSVLSTTGQFLPVDADGDLTLGELFLHNVYGPLRAGYGAWRDLVLGLGFIDGLGRKIQVGGRTVKNVAGYDVSRFMVGSLGELGFPFELTLRTFAAPGHVTIVEAQWGPPSANTITPFINHELTLTEPSEISVTHTGDSFTLRVGYFSRPGQPAHPGNALRHLFESSGHFSEVCLRQLSHEDNHASKAALQRWRRTAPVVVKCVVPPASTLTTAAKLVGWARQSRQSLELEAIPTHGCLFAGGSLDADAAVSLDDHLHTTIASQHGLWVWHARPSGKSRIQPFGPDPATASEWAMLKKLKRAFDPLGLLNPGRLLPVTKDP